MSPEYVVWSGMKERCLNPSNTTFADYGGRGITICARWLDSFESFFADMGPRPPGTSINRIDNNGNYEPGNCRWATPKEQAGNTRRSIIVDWQGERMTVAECARREGLPYTKLLRAVKRDRLPIAEAVAKAHTTRPPGSYPGYQKRGQK